MKGPTLEKNHLGVQSVTRDAQYQVMFLRHMRGYIKERNHSAAQNVTRASHMLMFWSHFVQFCAVICMGNVMKITHLEVRTVRWVKFELSNPNSGLAEFELFVVRYLPNGDQSAYLKNNVII